MYREWLFDIRMKAQKTQQQVADGSGITREYYCMIESGKRNPAYPICCKIASFLGFSWTRFYEDSPLDQTG